MCITKLSLSHGSGPHFLGVLAMAWKTGISTKYTPQLVQTEYVGKLDVDEK